jgi:hypothetical protein
MKWMNSEKGRGFLAKLFQRLMKNWAWVVLVLLVIPIRIAASHPEWVEKYYTYGIYPVLAQWLRWAFGWLPLSVGDVFYGAIILLIIFKTGWLLKDLWKRKVDRAYWVSGLQQFIFVFLFLYVFFNLLWGLNYNRQGIGHQLGIHPDSASVAELDTLTTLLLEKANYYRDREEAGIRKELHRKRNLFSQTVIGYEKVGATYPFLQYAQKSLKPSLYSYAGNYLGFQGYYNPFSGEGQVNTTIPVFVQPFVASHELAHQLGYAKESEANFVGYLAAKEHPSNFFRYSTYLDMYLYAHAQLYFADSTRARQIRDKASTRVKNDIVTLRKFYQRYQTPIEEWVTLGYDYFLQANQQPQGKKSYGQVTGWLLAWVRKMGWEAL